MSAWLWRSITTPPDRDATTKTFCAAYVFRMQSSCLECNIYLVNVLQAHIFPLLPILVSALSYAAKHTIHATLGALCHRYTTLNADISSVTSETHPFCLALAPSSAVVSSLQDKQIQPLGTEVGRNIQKQIKAEVSRGLLRLKRLIHITLAPFQL